MSEAKFSPKDASQIVTHNTSNRVEIKFSFIETKFSFISHNSALFRTLFEFQFENNFDANDNFDLPKHQPQYRLLKVQNSMIAP